MHTSARRRSAKWWPEVEAAAWRAARELVERNREQSLSRLSCRRVAATLATLLLSLQAVAFSFPSASSETSGPTRFGGHSNEQTFEPSILLEGLSSSKKQIYSSSGAGRQMGKSSKPEESIEGQASRSQVGGSVTSEEWPLEPVGLSLVSARNSLAFWQRAASEEPADLSGWFGSGKAKRPGPPKQQEGRPETSRCGRKRPASELVAVEGTASLKVNLVIVLARREQPSTEKALRGELPTLAAPDTGNRLRLHWTRNGEPLATNANHRFQQQLINENNLVRQYFASNRTTDLLRHPALDTSGSARLAGSRQARQNPFMLAPFVDQRLSAWLDANSAPNQQELLKELNAIQAGGGSGHQPAGTKRPLPAEMVDEFLGEANSVDWQRLEAFLRLQVGLEEACKLEQLLVLQLSLNNLNLQDRGLYQLALDCDERSRAGCLQLSFRLQVVEDVPRLESRAAERKLLEPGERLSIKCEATGFTLPQITWFLDGQQLNEHQQPLGGADGPLDSASPQAADLGYLLSSSSSGQLANGRLRIGDYVTQDNNLVHSFVNSSHVQVADGGYYKCQANNGFHMVEHEIRVDVRGPPLISRLIQNMSVLSNQPQVAVQCPYSGYPIHAVEWYFRPLPASKFGPLDSSTLDLVSLSSYPPGSPQMRAKRLDARRELPKGSPSSGLEENRELELDPERDEWLAQASAMTGAPDEYPEPMPDYPEVGGLLEKAPDYQEYLWAEEGDFWRDSLAADYSYLPTNLQQGLSLRRRKRAVEEQQWVKFPQGRRHQVHQNGTLIINELTRADQGLYKCRVLAPADEGAKQDTKSANFVKVSSNEFLLTVLVPPVISPFSSSESLREGMRNFLTCSVIEGDSPVRLRWFKDEQPIELYIQEEELELESSLANNQAGGGRRQARIKVETSNEFTSTLFFSHVHFKDNGNYTCMASNKAASVNYTAKMLVNVPPKWIRAPKDMEAVSGQNIVIDCQAQAHPNPRVWWEIGVASNVASSSPAASPLMSGLNEQSHKLSRIAAEHNSKPSAPTSSSTSSQAYQLHPPNHYRTIISNSRIHILENASLVIRDVNKSDQGYYLCQAANNFGSLSSLIKLTVNVGAGFQSKYQVKYAKVNEHVELDCDPSGQSPLELVWLHKSSPAAALNNSNTRVQHLLEPSSRVSSSLAQQHPLMQAEPPRRRLFAGSIRSESQQQLQLEGLEQAEAAQLFTDSSGTSFEVVRRPGSEEGAGSEYIRLVIKQAKRLHSGDYICQASNKYGTDERLIKLLVQEPPDGVQEISVVQVESRSISLSWLPPFNGNSPINSYSVEWASLPAASSGGDESLAEASSASSERGQHSQSGARWSRMSSQQSSATISGLQPLTSYEVRVIAHNQLGQSRLEATQALVVSTSEEAPSSPPSDVRASAVSSSSLQLSWLPPGVESFTQQPGEPNRTASYSVKGYYLGYKELASNDSYIFKTVSLLDATQSATISPFLLHRNSLGADSEPLLALPASLDTRSRQAAGRRPAPAGKDSLEQAAERDEGRRLRVLIGELKRNTKYSVMVQAFNSAGPGPQSDPVEARTLVSDPPPAPTLHVGVTTYSSLELQWSFPTFASQLDFGHAPHNHTALDGYYLYFRPSADDTDWTERKLSHDTHAILQSMVSSSGGQARASGEFSLVEISSLRTEAATKANQLQEFPWSAFNSTAGGQRNSSASNLQLANKTFRFVLDQLSCGTAYQVYLLAYNAIGPGLASQIVRTKTRGSPPIAPRKQDFILANSSSVQLNLEAWMDGGCSISNFEVRYRQSQGKPNAGSISGAGKDFQWLLLSNDISPEQRTLDIPDLQPESWYSLLASAESVAGKTEQLFTFMTLDRMGRLPAEALEPSVNLPSLFRAGNGGFKSILFGLNNSHGLTSSELLMSSLVCLLMIGLCLFLLRKYSGNLKDSASIDSQTTSGAMSSTNLFVQRAQNSLAHSSVATNNTIFEAGRASVYGDGSELNRNHDYLSTKSSPCKSSGLAGGHCNLAGSSSQAVQDQTQYAQAEAAGEPRDYFQPLSSDCSQYLNQEQLVQEGYCCNSHQLQPRQANKFATLARDQPPALASNSSPISHQQMSLLDQHNRFKTLPHSFQGEQQRPVSSFIPNGLYGNSSRLAGCHQSLDHSQQQQQQPSLEQQQVYSKLRLICNSNSNYNLYPMEQCAGGNSTNQQAINLAVLAQQNPKLMLTLKRASQNLYAAQNNCASSELMGAPEMGANSDQVGEMSSLLVDLQQQVASNQLALNQEQQQQRSLQAGSEQQQMAGAHAGTSPSLASSSTATNSTQASSSATTTSSSLTNEQDQQKLLLNKLASDINQSLMGRQSAGSGPQLTSGGAVSSEQQPQQQQQLPQSDYALPFFPKWV